MITSCIFFLEETVRKYPDKIAIIDESKRYTFTELRENAIRLSAHIPAEWRNQPIAVYLPKSADCVVAFLGILYSANFYIPLDTKSPVERLAKVVNNLVPKAIITSSKYKETVEAFCAGINPVILDFSSVMDSGRRDLQKNHLDRVQRVVDADPMYCIYTSGSTGIPKGVVVSHKSVVDFIDWASVCYELGESTVIGNQSPFIFDVSVLDIYVMLKESATLFIIPERLFAFPANLIDFVNDNKINFIIWVPSVLINIANANVLAGRELKTLNKVLFAGESMPNKQLNHWRKHLPNALYSNLYGPTEATVIACYYIVDREFDDSDPLPIGFPCRNCDLLVLNDCHQPVSDDEIGELCIRGTSLALGYWNDQEKTNEVFAQNPLNPHYPERVYRTGDLVKFNERGEIVFLGRKDSQIKYAGYRIELGEIENAVLGIKDIDHACVVFHEEKTKITLFYVSSNDSVNDVFIRTALLGLLPKYMIPATYFRLESLPLNANGKIDRLALKKSFCQDNNGLKSAAPAI